MQRFSTIQASWKQYNRSGVRVNNKETETMKEINLYDYQTKAVNDIRNEFKEGNKSVILVMPTGSGKTHSFSYITKLTTENKKRVLILVHRVELLRQASNSLKVLGIEHGLISPKYTPNKHALVQVASVQTLIRRMSKFERPSLIIIDESHHAIAGSWRKVIDYYHDARILGVTATPCRTDNKPLSDVFDVMVQGPQIYELIDMGFLVKPIVYGCSSQVDLGEVRIKGSDYDREEVAQLMDRPQIIGDAVEHYTKLAAGKSCVVFCINVKHAINTAQEFRNAGYNFHAVYGDMLDSERDRILKGLGDGTIQGVTSADLISEGTDIPAIEVAILLRPTWSLSLFIQQVGRALRTAPGKTHALILDHVGNCSRHGLPDSHRDWTLEGQKKMTKKRASEMEIKAKQCEECYQVFEPAPECPYCGHRNTPTARELEIIEGELQLLTEENMKKQKRMEVGKADSLEDFQRIAHERGYKQGWAFMKWQHKAKKMLG